MHLLLLRRSAVALLAVVIACGYAAMSTGCSGPYSGKPETLKSPKKKKRPKGEEAASAEVVIDDKCRTNFFEKPTTRRKPPLGRSLAQQAEKPLFEAEEQEGEERIILVRDAMSKLRNALKADPYGPEPTYKMAVAYALVGKKGCSLALLERLQLLSGMPGVESEAERAINRALRDQAFDLFRKEADTALGR